MAFNTYEPFAFRELHFTEDESGCHFGNDLSAREKGKWRTLVILDWLYRWRYSAFPVLLKLTADLEDPERQKTQIKELLNRLAKRGWIRKFPLITGFTKVGYCLTNQGFLYLQQHQPDRIFEQKVYTETSTLTASNFVHDLAIQTMISKQIAESEDYFISYLNEFEIRRLLSESGSTQRKAFDAIFTTDKTFGVEVELTPKSGSRLASAIQTAYRHIQNGDVDRVIYFAPTNGMKKLITRTISRLDENEEIDERDFSVSVPETLSKLIKGA